MICDNALVSGYAADKRPVGYDIVYEVCRDFDLGPPEKSGSRRSSAAAVAHAAPASPAPPQPPVVQEAATQRPVAELFGVFTRPRRFSFF